MWHFHGLKDRVKSLQSIGAGTHHSHRLLGTSQLNMLFLWASRPLKEGCSVRMCSFHNHATVSACKSHSLLSSCDFPMVPRTAAAFPLCMVIEMHCRRYSQLRGSPVVFGSCLTDFVTTLLIHIDAHL